MALAQYEVDGNLKPILSGLAPLPNASEVHPLEFLNNLAAGGHMMNPIWGWAMLPDSRCKQWTQFFLTQGGMGGCLDGRGYAVTYGGNRLDDFTQKSAPAPIIRHFAICKHEQQLAAGANPGRGWHPGSCVHCGMDMTVDSGD